MRQQGEVGLRVFKFSHLIPRSTSGMVVSIPADSVTFPSLIDFDSTCCGMRGGRCQTFSINYSCLPCKSPPITVTRILSGIWYSCCFSFVNWAIFESFKAASSSSDARRLSREVPVAVLVESAASSFLRLASSCSIYLCLEACVQLMVI